MSLRKMAASLEKITGCFRSPKTAEDESNLLKESIPKSTVYKNKWAVKVFREWKASKKVEVPVLDPGGAFKDSCELLVKLLAQQICPSCCECRWRGKGISFVLMCKILISNEESDENIVWFRYDIQNTCSFHLGFHWVSKLMHVTNLSILDGLLSS